LSETETYHTYIYTHAETHTGGYNITFIKVVDPTKTCVFLYVYIIRDMAMHHFCLIPS